MTEFLKQIPVSKQGFGEITDEIIEALEALDEELMKRGTLAVDSIDWPELHKKAESLLPQVCHLQAYRALIIAVTAPEISGCIQESGLITAFATAQHLTDKAWPEMHPQGARLKRKRDAWMNDIVQALASAVDDASEQNVMSCAGVKAAEKLVKSLRKAEIDSRNLERALKNQPADLPEVTASPQPAAARPRETARPAAAAAQTVQQRLDAKGRADLRRDIQALADRISHHEPDAGIAWLMRGYASWLEYTQAPEAQDAEGVTDQPAMPAFVAEEHRKNATTPDLATLKKLEDRLFMSPDWFEGQQLAAEMAQRLDMPGSSAAIRQRVQDRLAQLPELKDLRHQNGTEIVPEEVQSWAADQSAAPIVVQSEATAMDDDAEAGDPLAQAETAIGAARSLREAALAQFSFARTLIAGGHLSHADSIAGMLLNHFSEPFLKEWDHRFWEDLKELRQKAAVGREISGK